MDDETVEAGVGDEEIAAAAEDEDWKRAFTSEGYGFEKLIRAGDADEPARRAAYAECGVLRVWDILLNRHAFKPNPTTTVGRALAHHRRHSYNRD